MTEAWPVSIPRWKQLPQPWNARAANAAAEPNVGKWLTWSYGINIIPFTGGVYSLAGCWGTSLLSWHSSQLEKHFSLLQYAENLTVLEPQSPCSDLIPKIPSQLPKEGRRSCMDTNLWFYSWVFFCIHARKTEGSIPIVHWSNTPGAGESTLCNSWGSWQTWIWRNAVAPQRAWQPDPLCVTGAHALTTSQSSSSQIPLTVLTPNLSPLYTFSSVPLTTHTKSPWHI